MSKLPIDLVGKRFGRLLVESYAGHTKWNVVCDCGKRKLCAGIDLRGGDARSCGCLQRDTVIAMSTRHGHSRTRTHRIWCGIRARCNTPSAKGYANYGGRGIKVCDRWKDFCAFLEDMGECPDGYSIERNDVDGDYEPSNCKWIPISEQCNNKKDTLYVYVDGIKKRLKEYAEEMGVNVGTMRARLYHGRPLLGESA